MSEISLRGRLLLGSELVPGAVVVEDGTIARILRGPDVGALPDPVVEADIIAPAFVDLQVNGGFGVEVGDDPKAIVTLSERLPETGVVAFLPTLVTRRMELYGPAVEAYLDGMEDSRGAFPISLHLEGPFLSTERPGVHDPDLIAAADWSLLDRFRRYRAVQMLTLAPERPGAIEAIARLSSLFELKIGHSLSEGGTVVSLGHTNASYEEFEAGVDAGARMATHLFNAMSPFDHRAPGAVGAALTDDRVTVGLIADGVHTHPASIELAIRAKGYDRVALITDMVAAAGMPPGRYDLAGQEVHSDGIAVRRPDGRLAGSALTMDQAVRNVVRWTGTPVAQALRMASEIPARLIGEKDFGSPLQVGALAHLVLLDDTLHVQATLSGVHLLWSREDNA